MVVTTADYMSAIFLIISDIALINRLSVSKSAKNLFITTTLCILWCFIDGFAYTGKILSAPKPIVLIFETAVYSFSFVILLSFLHYANTFMKEKVSFNKFLFVIPSVVITIGFILILIDCFTGKVFTITENNILIAENLPIIPYLLLICVIIYVPILAIIFHKSLGYKAVIAMGLMGIVPVVLFVISNHHDIPDFSAIANSFNFVLIGVLLENDISLRTKKSAQEREKLLLQVSNTDELTKLENRRAYETYFSQVKNTTYEENLVYVSVDINSLKVTNDTLGHYAGDELIIGTADCLKQVLGQYGTIYRTGGDEFAGIIHVSDNEIKKIIKNLSDSVENWRGNLVKKLSISIGYVCWNKFKNLSLMEISVAAEKKMYAQKTAYYIKNGFDQRGQLGTQEALSLIYNKVLKVNLTEETMQIIYMDEKEKINECGFSDDISKWLQEFGNSGFVHPDNIVEYLEKTNLSYIKKYLKNHDILSISYKRKKDNDFKNVTMEFRKASNYSEDNQNIFIFVKDI